MPDYLDQGDQFTNAVVNLEKLLQLHRNELELVDIFSYDEQLIPQTPCAAIVFERGNPVPKSLGGRCSLMNVDVSIFLYLESLSIGQQTIEHVGRFGMMTRILYKNNDLFGLCHSEHMIVNSAQMVGRRLQSDVYLTGQIELSVPQRFCKDERP